MYLNNYYFIGFTPLMTAAYWGHKEVVDLLLNQDGINTDLQANSSKLYK